MTINMMNAKSDIKIMLLNVYSLKLYLLDVFLLLEKMPCSIVLLSGTHPNEEAIKMFSKHFSNYRAFSKKGTNSFGGVIIAVHRSIPVQKVEAFSH